MGSKFRISVTVDHEAGAAYVQLGANPVETTEQFDEAVLVDLDDLGVVVGIEFLNLSANVDLDELVRRYHLTTKAEEAIRQSARSQSSFVSTPATGQLSSGLVTR